MAQIPYIGAKISLISRSNIRYEGTLYTIDPREATVALSNVRCFGTEGRNPENEMPASPEVYEFIIFRGRDIQDLQVCDQPPPPRPTPLSDPAIIGTNRPANFQPPPEPAPAPQAPPQEPAQSHDHSQKNQNQNQRGAVYQPPARGGNRNGGQARVVVASSAPAPIVVRPFSGAVSGNHGGSVAKPHSQPAARAPVEEFDLAAANVKFTRDALAQMVKPEGDAEVGEAAAGVEHLSISASLSGVSPAYDKSKSFFDDLSVERTSNSQRSRQNDTETFGSEAGNFRGGRRPYRGGRGRGRRF